jgi:large subunit ribosomal protein L3
MDKEDHMARKLMGKKRGMMQLFDDQGNAVVCTVIEAEPNVVTEIKTKEKHGYNAIQLGFEKIVTKDPRTVQKRVKKPQLGHFNRVGVEPRRYLSECRVDGAFEVGQELGVGIFEKAELVDVRARSIGKGYQGVMKKYNFAGASGASHGAGPVHRHAGSTGMRSTPGRCFKGGPRPSHMGDNNVTVQGLRVMMVRPEDNIIVVKGSIPGPKNGLVYISEAVKAKAKK